MSVRDPLRKLSLEGVFGSIKQKLGSSFRAVREDVSINMALAYALLWNLYRKNFIFDTTSRFYLTNHIGCVTLRKLLEGSVK